MDSDKGYSGMSERKNIKNKMPTLSEEKKIKGEFHDSIDFWWFGKFFTRKMYAFRRASWHVRGENKIKADLSIIFSCRTYFQLHCVGRFRE